jgi:hypothetical protein
MCKLDDKFAAVKSKHLSKRRRDDEKKLRWLGASLMLLSGAY